MKEDMHSLNISKLEKSLRLIGIVAMTGFTVGAGITGYGSLNENPDLFTAGLKTAAGGLILMSVPLTGLGYSAIRQIRKYQPSNHKSYSLT